MKHSSRRRVLASAGGALLALALAGCSSGSSPSGSATTTAPATGATGATASAGGGATAGDTITIQNFAFSPASLTVAPGATVTVVNKDGVSHDVSSTSAGSAFTTGILAGGASATFKAPSKAGSYSYICSIHTYMHGTLTVQ